MTSEELRVAVRRETNRQIVICVLGIWIAQAAAVIVARTS
jgi:hypothetical protein